MWGERERGGVCRPHLSTHATGNRGQAMGLRTVRVLEANAAVAGGMPHAMCPVSCGLGAVWRAGEWGHMMTAIDVGHASEAENLT